MDNPLSLRAAVEKYEQSHLKRVLLLCEWNKGMAAQLLGISRKNLWEKCRRHGIEKPTFTRSS